MAGSPDLAPVAFCSSQRLSIWPAPKAPAATFTSVSGDPRGKLGGEVEGDTLTVPTAPTSPQRRPGAPAHHSCLHDQYGRRGPWKGWLRGEGWWLDRRRTSQDGRPLRSTLFQRVWLEVQVVELAGQRPDFKVSREVLVCPNPEECHVAPPRPPTSPAAHAWLGGFKQSRSEPRRVREAWAFRRASPLCGPTSVCLRCLPVPLLLHPDPRSRQRGQCSRPCLLLGPALALFPREPPGRGSTTTPPLPVSSGPCCSAFFLPHPTWTK